jgi:hypothetical protein
VRAAWLTVTFDTVAFIPGYANDAFRFLIAKLTQLLFAPGKVEPNGPREPGSLLLRFLV